jgi:hypothetical protein
MSLLCIPNFSASELPSFTLHPSNFTLSERLARVD